MNIIHLVDSISDSDGVSSHVLQLLKHIDKNKAGQFLLCGKIISARKFGMMRADILEHPEFLHLSRSVRNFASAARILYALCKKHDAGVIHSHTHYSANIAWYVSKLNGVKTIQTIHGIIPETGKLSHFKADRFICVSEPGVEYLKKQKKIDGNRISLIRQGVTLSHDCTRERFDSEEIRVAALTRLEYEKGPDVFIKAAGIVNSQYPNVRFTLAGRGSMKDELLALNEKCNGNVFFAGEVPDPNDILNNTDIFVMPGREKNEGFPMAIAEAAVSGCLVITSGFDSLSYVFDERTDGLSFAINDHKELADKIISAVYNRSDSKRRAGLFQKKARKLFDINKFTEKHLRVYDE